MTIEFKAEQYFDPEKCRQYINKELSVFHCHHYATLFTQLADDAEAFEGPKNLRDSAEESMGPVLKKYFKDNNIQSKEDRICIIEKYFSFVGLGKLVITEAINNSGKAEMINSHVDEGWIKKWKKRKKPINYIGQGFLACAFSAIFDEDYGTYKIEETQSIVTGADKSCFIITKN